MKQKYLYYTLFGLLAVNMSWNFVGTTNRGEVNLASTRVYELGEKTVALSKADILDAEVRYDSTGNEITKNYAEVTVQASEGNINICDCLIGTTLKVETDGKGKFKEGALLAALNAQTVKAEADAKIKADAAEIAATENKAKADEAKRKKEACVFPEKLDRLDCHTERVDDIAAQIKENSCNSSSSVVKECAKLEAAYDIHKEAVASMLNEALEDSRSDDRLVAKEGRVFMKLIEKSTSPIIKTTARNLLQAERDFAATENEYAKIPQLMAMAIKTGNPWYGMQAKFLTDNLKSYVGNNDVRPYLESQMDKNFRGGLSDNHVDYFLQRNTDLRKALGIDSIYPTNIGQIGLSGTSTSSIAAINFRGGGFSGNYTEIGVPAAVSTGGAVVGQLDLSNLSGIRAGSQTASAVNPVGARVYVRE